MYVIIHTEQYIANPRVCQPPERKKVYFILVISIWLAKSCPHQISPRQISLAFPVDAGRKRAYFLHIYGRVVARDRYRSVEGFFTKKRLRIA